MHGVTAIVISTFVPGRGRGFEPAVVSDACPRVLIACTRADLVPFASDDRWRHTRRQARGAVWTDDFSNVLSVIRWRE